MTSGPFTKRKKKKYSITITGMLFCTDSPFLMSHCFHTGTASTKSNNVSLLCFLLLKQNPKSSPLAVAQKTFGIISCYWNKNEPSRYVEKTMNSRFHCFRSRSLTLAKMIFIVVVLHCLKTVTDFYNGIKKPWYMQVCVSLPLWFCDCAFTHAFCSLWLEVGNHYLELGSTLTGSCMLS